MVDLHGWITQQIDRVEAGTRSATPGPWTADTDDDNVMADAGTVARMWDYVRSGSDVQVKADMSLIIAHADPTAVLRRCAADRKILAEHRPHGGKWEPYACEGCGMDGGDCADWMIEHVNDCPTLLALAEGYGLTEEQRAALDRPEPERPAPTGPGLLPDGLAEAMFGNLYAAFLGTRPVEPRPEVKAMEILAPELKKIPGYIPTTEEQP
jgi:hypothetical protein